MADEDTESPRGDLGPWLQELMERSGMSVRGLSQMLGVDRKNLKGWQGGKGMTATNLLAYLNAVGATIEPPPPAPPHSLSNDLRSLDSRLAEVEGRLLELVRLVRKALEQLPASEAPPVQGRKQPSKRNGT